MTTSPAPPLAPPARFERPLWARENLNLLVQATRCAFISRDKSSVLGVVWHLLNPLLTTLVLYGVFSRVMRVRDVPHYPLFILLGVMQFNFFSQATTQAAQSVLNGRNLILNSNIRREVLVLRAVGVEALSYLIGLLVVTGLVAMVRGGLPLTAALFPLVLLIHLAFTVGVSLALGATVVFLPDLVYLWGVGMRLLFFVTPIFYTMKMVREGWMQQLIGLNPLARVVDLSTRVMVVGQAPELPSLLAAAGGAAAALALGALVFQRLTARIPEHV